MRRKRTFCGMRKRIISAGIGILAAASAASMVSMSAYASLTTETRAETPGVSGKHHVEMSEERETLNSIFEVVEVDRLWYQVTVTVVDKETGLPILDAYVTFEDQKTNELAGLYGGGTSYKTDANGQITFLLEMDHNYTLTIKKSGYKEHEHNGKTFSYGDGSQNQTLYLELEKLTEKPTKPTEPTKPEPTKPTEPTKPEPTKPTEPTKPEPTKPTPTRPSGGGGGGGGGKDHDKDKPTLPAESTTAASTETKPNPSESSPAETSPKPARKPGETKPSETSPAESSPEETLPPESDADNDNEYILPGKDGELGTDDDVRVRPSMDADGKNNSYQREDGAVVLPDGGTVIYEDGTSIDVPPGTIVLPDGTIIYPQEEETGSHRISFGDCWFHWLEILAVIVIAGLSLRRLQVIRDIHKELDEMEQTPPEADLEKEE